MTENTPPPAELLAEARAFTEAYPSLRSGSPADLVDRLTLALESVTAERDDLSARVTKAERIIAGYDRTVHEENAARANRDAEAAYKLYRAEQAEHAATRAGADALAAILAEAMLVADDLSKSSYQRHNEMRAILSKLPADALALVKAAAWDEGMNEGYHTGMNGEATLSRNPYRTSRPSGD